MDLPSPTHPSSKNTGCEHHRNISSFRIPQQPGAPGNFFLHHLLPKHVRLDPPLLDSRFELRLLSGSPQHRPWPARHHHSQDPALSAHLSVLPLRNSILPRSPSGPRQPQGVLHTPPLPTLSHLLCLPPIGRGGRVTFGSPPLGLPTPSQSQLRKSHRGDGLGSFSLFPSTTQWLRHRVEQVRWKQEGRDFQLLSPTSVTFDS